MSHSINGHFTPASLLKFAAPSIIMMMFMSLYTIIDGIFISRFVGSNALSSLNIVYPIINIVFAIGTMLGTGGNAIITTEVGQNQMWAAQFYDFDKPRTLITSGGLGTMGYGFPAAIGAQVAFPNKLVIDIAGDGSIQMNIQEMATAVQNKLPVKIVILNNTYLGMVRQWQELFYKHNYSSTSMTGQPDFVKLAEAYGAEGYRIMTEEELAPTLKKALASPNTAIIDVVVEPEEDVYPMVPAGASLDEMLLV